MPTVAKNKKAAPAKAAKRATTRKVYNDRVSEEVGNYEKHPFFVKKANKVKELLKQVGLPKDFVTKTS